MGPVGQAALITSGATVATLVVDRALKLVAERRLDEGERAHGPLGIRVRRVTNDSVMHPLLLAAGGVLALGIAGAGTLATRPAMLQVGAGLVAGGMLGNLVDRAAGSGVTDFLATPLGIINGADAAIGAGIALAGIGLVLR